MRAYSPLAMCLLLAAGPALAGKDFCDTGDGDGGRAHSRSIVSGHSVPTGPTGGSCEANMIVTDQPQAAGSAYWRLRDLPYNAGNIDALKGFEDWPELPLCLEEVHLPSGNASLRAAGVIEPPIGEPGGPYSESTFLEWTFQPIGIEMGERVMTLSVLVDGRGTYLRADWLQPSQREWSYANGGGALAPVKLDSRLVRLYGSGQFSPQRFTLLHDGAFVRVGLGLPVREWISFALPHAQWRPTRLRNGLVAGTPLSQGLGLRVAWPTVIPGKLNRESPGEEQPQPDPDPTTPQLD